MPVISCLTSLKELNFCTPVALVTAFILQGVSADYLFRFRFRSLTLGVSGDTAQTIPV